MKIKSITRIDGKIRIISENSGQERVDDFEDYGLPEVDHLIKSFLEHNVVCFVGEPGRVEDYYKIGNCDYAIYRHIHISIPESKPYRNISIGKCFTNVFYITFIYTLYGCVRFTTDILSCKWNSYSWLGSKKFVKQFDGKHITNQSLEKHAAAAGYYIFRFSMETITRSSPRDIATKLM